MQKSDRERSRWISSNLPAENPSHISERAFLSARAQSRARKLVGRQDFRQVFGRAGRRYPPDGRWGSGVPQIQFRSISIYASRMNSQGFRSHVTVLVVMVALVLGGVAASGQRPAPGGAAAGGPLIVDFTAMTADGTPVADLTPADVAIKIGGKVRTVTSLVMKKVEAAGAPAAAGPRQQQPRRPTSRRRLRPTTRRPRPQLQPRATPGRFSSSWTTSRCHPRRKRG